MQDNPIIIVGVEDSQPTEILDCNSSVTQLLNFPVDDLIGRSVASLAAGPYGQVTPRAWSTPGAPDSWQRVHCSTMLAKRVAEVARGGEAVMDGDVMKRTLMLATHRNGFLIPTLVAVKVPPGGAVASRFSNAIASCTDLTLHSRATHAGFAQEAYENLSDARVLVVLWPQTTAVNHILLRRDLTVLGMSTGAELHAIRLVDVLTAVCVHVPSRLPPLQDQPLGGHSARRVAAGMVRGDGCDRQCRASAFRSLSISLRRG